MAKVACTSVRVMEGLLSSNTFMGFIQTQQKGGIITRSLHAVTVVSWASAQLVLRNPFLEDSGEYPPE